MKVLLASASYPTPFTFHRKFLGLGYIHAHALADKELSDRLRIDHQYYDTRIKEAAQIAEEVAAEGPDLVCFGCYVWNTPRVLDIVKQLKRITPGQLVFLGGPEVDYHYEEVLRENPGVDFVSVGEGEENFRGILHELLKDGKPGNVPGIAVRKDDGSPFLSKTRMPAKDLDCYESPYLSNVLGVDEVQGGVYFQTTRGCPFKCAYCDYGGNRPVAAFSLSRAEAELDFFKAHGAEKVFCVDSTFNLDRKRAKRLLDRMAEISLDAALWIEAHPNLLDEAFVEAVGKTRLTYLGLGLQTLSHKAMENINRKWDPDRIGALLDRLAVNKSCLLGLEIIMGLPGDDLESFKESLSWVYSKEPTNVFAFNLEVLPRTMLHTEAKRFGIEEGGAGSSHEIVSNSTFPADQVMIGKAMTDWNRQMQPIFYRLSKLTGVPAGDLIEMWAWHAYNAGLHESLSELHSNRVDEELLDRLADLFEESAAGLFATKGLADLSRHMRELLRYIYSRRSVTSESAVFTDALDVNCITTDPQHNRILDKGALVGKPRPEGAREESFDFDMKKLWPIVTVDEMRALKPEKHTYLFFSGKNGAAAAVEMP